MTDAIDVRLEVWALGTAAPLNPFDALKQNQTSNHSAQPLARVAFEISGQRFAAIFKLATNAAVKNEAADCGSLDAAVARKVPATTLISIAVGDSADLTEPGCRLDVAVRRVKPGFEAEISRWQAAFGRHKDEALESILREGVLAEAWFRFDLEDAAYLIALVITGSPRCYPFARLHGGLAIDSAHRNFKRHWDRDFVYQSERF